MTNTFSKSHNCVSILINTPVSFDFLLVIFSFLVTFLLLGTWGTCGAILVFSFKLTFLPLYYHILQHNVNFSRHLPLLLIIIWDSLEAANAPRS